MPLALRAGVPNLTKTSEYEAVMSTVPTTTREHAYMRLYEHEIEGFK